MATGASASGYAPLVLVVSGNGGNHKSMEALLTAAGYRTILAANGKEALERAVQSPPPDVVLLDMVILEMDGFEIAARLKNDFRTKRVPIVMMTAPDNRQSRLRALEVGIEEFLIKPVDRAELTVRLRNLLKIKEYSDFLSDYNHILEQQVVERTRQLTASYRETIATMTSAAAYKDEETGAHVKRISLYTVELAASLGMDEDFRDTIHYASPMHDVGKIAIPDAILGKLGKFEPHEWEIMKTHAALGAALLSGRDSPYLKMGADIAGEHHERWDGGGYPRGLKGEAIKLSARIMQICDVYDAQRSTRPYKAGFTHERVVEIITNGDGRTLPDHFDPAALDAFKHCTERFRDIYETYLDER